MIQKILFLFLFSIASFSFSQEKAIEKLVASPNPFTNNTTISFKANIAQPTILSVRNVLGKTVYRKKLWAKKGVNTFNFERGDLKSGVYIYAIQSNNNITSKRFVIR